MTANFIITKWVLGWELQHMDGLVGTRVTLVEDREVAVRLAELLNRNGLVDVSMDGIEAEG